MRCRVGRLDHAIVHLRQRLGQHGLFATPPGVQRRQQQLLAQQARSQRRQKAENGTGFEKTGARQIRHDHIAGADRLQQAGNAKPGFGPQLQRVEILVINALDQHIDLLQPVQGFQIELAVTHGQIAALDQRNAEIACQIGLLEIGFVERSRREQGNMGALARRAAAAQAGNQRPVERGQALHAHAIQRLRKLLRHHMAVFQHVAQTGRCLQALRYHPPVAVRIT